MMNVLNIQRQIPRAMFRCLSSTGPLKPFEELPTLSLWDMALFANPRNETRHQEVMAKLHAKHGSIFKLKFPGTRHHQVWINDPQFAKEVLDQVIS